jgi:hypothetical protein
MLCIHERLTMAIKMPHAKPDTSDRKAEAFIHAKPTPPDPDAGKTVVNMRFDVALLKRIDEAARSQGISRTAWLHVAASKALE